MSLHTDTMLERDEIVRGLMDEIFEAPQRALINEIVDSQDSGSLEGELGRILMEAMHGGQ